MAYVTGSAWVERGFADGLRACLAEDFASVHVFHLRGDIRKTILSGGHAGEGENVFGQGTMTGVAITVVVKNPDAREQGRILFHDIGDDLDRKQKLDAIRLHGSVAGVAKAGKWSRITPDKHGDWLDQRDARLKNISRLGTRKTNLAEFCLRTIPWALSRNGTRGASIRPDQSWPRTSAVHLISTTTSEHGCKRLGAPRRLRDNRYQASTALSAQRRPKSVGAAP